MMALYAVMKGKGEWFLSSQSQPASFPLPLAVLLWLARQSLALPLCFRACHFSASCTSRSTRRPQSLLSVIPSRA